MIDDVLHLDYRDPATLDPNPANWKQHPGQQVDALAAAIFGGDRGGRRVGWAGALLMNRRTGRLLDGHARRALAIAHGEATVPVLVGDWSEEEEREILATLDPLGYGATIDAAAFDQLTRDMDTGSAALQAMLAAVREAGDLFDPPAPDPAPSLEGAGPAIADPPAVPEPDPAGDLVDPFDCPDGLFPSDNPYGIPLLDARLEAECADFPVTTWGTVGHRTKQTGTYHFYTDDKRFSPLWQDPSKVLFSGSPSMVEPNFSTHEQTPTTVALWSIYRKRWLARWWQSKGRRIFVDLNVHHRLLLPDESLGGARLNLLGVPHGWRSYATRAHGNRPELLDVEYGVAVEHAAGNTPYFLVVGGGDAVKQLCTDRGWQNVPESSESARAGKKK